MTHAHDSNPKDPDQVCILWHAADRSPADALVRVLSKRGFAVMPTSSMHTVFGSACRCVKVSQRVVIVLDGRKSLVGVDRVLDGLERFGPGVICWEHVEGANPPMVPVVRTVPLAHVQPEPVLVPESVLVPEPRAVSKPTPSELRLVGDTQPDPTKPAAEPIKRERVISSSDVLNADELDALLASEIGNGRGK